ncbi:MAG: 2-oxoglutarate dehydrogenase E1 component [Alphaproteobacteria bacterium]|nr:2-oxoglutarate dehydrogenase E1 component [Alphaproteobacteria bacterium]
MPHSSNAALKTILTGFNAEYIAQLYAAYLNNQSSVDESWRAVFADLQDDEAALLAEISGASWGAAEFKNSPQGFDQNHSTQAVPTNAVAPQKGGKIAQFPTHAQPQQSHAGVNVSHDVEQATRDSIAALMMIRAYRALGHLSADLDPLGLKQIEVHKELDPSFYGFGPQDMKRKIYIGGVLGLDYATIGEIADALRHIYCGKIGVEFLHSVAPEEKSWIQEKIEAARNHTPFTAEEKRRFYQNLVAAEGLEKFLHTKHVGTKRFGIDGGESFIASLEEIIHRGAELGCKEVVIGMAHRGRLNVLTNVVGKPYTTLFAEFQGISTNPDDILGTGDVKYHMGFTNDKNYGNHPVHVTLTANPSHLEAVNPVVIGRVRAKQFQRQDKAREQVIPILVHGDAAFIGQGVVAETLIMSELPGYSVGGTIHIVINNQIGFTTMPKYSRSGPYCTDMAKILSAPIFHVNGDDVESVMHVSRLAAEFRQTFKKDVVVDIFCYRRYGHNEGDEPSFTQPLMYKKIKTLDNVREIYGRQLISEKIIDQATNDSIVADFQTKLDQAYEATKGFKANKADYLEGYWSGLKVAYGDERRGTTAVALDRLKFLGERLTHVPENFHINPKIARQLEQKSEMFKTGQGFDWGTAEALAFASLLDEGTHVRLSGEDVGRGTFSHRHAIIYDQENEEKLIPLNHLRDSQASFEVHDSPLSEFAVLGFELGYSWAEPRALVLWEAQFGDFVNGAQIIIDQFLASSESKWLRMSGLVMLLPHGFEGQGPEHSSARLERFLQLCAEDNLQICNITTPANYFHALRRQIHRDFRKPLINMAPKSLLRHKLAVSPIDHFTGESTFHRVLWDDGRDMLCADRDMARVVLCSGKVYYDLLEERNKRGIKNVVILRLEQLYPFPDRVLADELKKYPNADVIWCQEEPKNQGAWSFVNPLLEDVLVGLNHKTTRAKFVGRVATAAPATGYLKRHNMEQARLVDDALTV